MKKIRSYLLIILISIGFAVFGQGGNVLITSLDVDRANGVVTVFYDLAPNEPNSFFDTEVSVILNMKKIKANSVSGDVGKYVQSGNGKMITWNARKDIGTVLEDDFIKVDVIAKRSSGMAKVKHNRNLIFGIGGVVVGGGLFGWGVSTEKDAKDIDEQLETAYDFEIEELTDEADKKHSKATILKAAGATVAAAGIFLIIKHINSNKKDQNVMIEPIIFSDPSIAIYQNNYAPAYGARLTVRF